MELSDSRCPSITVVSPRGSPCRHGKNRQVRHRASRVPVTMFPGLPGVCDPARGVYALPEQRTHGGLPRVRSVAAPEKRPISGLDTLPAHSPVHASLRPFPGAAHNSEPVWLARPSRLETYTPSHRAGLSRHTLTPAVSRRRKQERRRSGRWRRSAPVRGSARRPMRPTQWLIVL
jgi:hypothetical protein